MKSFRHLSSLLLGLALLIGAYPAVVPAPGNPPTLPTHLDDDEFWRIVSDFSEDGGHFPYDNFLSNEVSYQSVIPQLKMAAKARGVYIGVGPEQNFTYIAAIQPRIAFIVDIRRQNMLQMLLYKGLFELSADRADFVSRLFSRERPGALGASSSAAAIFQAYDSMLPSPQRLARTFEELKANLINHHHFMISTEDQQTIRRILGVFMEGGPHMDYGFPDSTSPIPAPSYSDLMKATDFAGHQHSYLASEATFKYVREMQLDNLVIPIVGDFGGQKALRAIASYLRAHNSTVTAFYVSNVEQYLLMDKPAFAAFRLNVATLPIDPSSMFIRFVPPISTTLASISDFINLGPGVFQLLSNESF